MLHSIAETPKCQGRIIYPYTDFVPEFYWSHTCAIPNVRVALEPEVVYWTPENPILITAGTGMGKTTFVYEVLIPLIMESGKNLLLISNRVALSTQQKEGVMKILNHKFQGRLPADVLREWTDFGQVRVITYHQLTSFVKAEENQAWIANLQYVVADECHYCAVDGSFNQWTGQHLHILTSKFKHAIRCYMTATEWDVLVPLASAEENAFPTCSEKFNAVTFGIPINKRHFIRYVFDPSYDHVNLDFFNDWNTIYEKIEKTPNEKWLIFVDSKQKGAEIMRKLGKKASYLDADSKETKAWNKLISEEMFDSQCLVATSALDCGININSDHHYNLVLVVDNRTSLTQMLGRKRKNRAKPNETVNLYVKTLSSKKLGYRLAQAYEIDAFAKRYELTWEGDATVGKKMREKLAAELWDLEGSPLHKYFTLWGGDLHMNKIAIHTLRRRIKFWESLKNPEVDFHNAVRSWLGKPTSNESAKEVLINFCSENAGKSLTKNELVSLRKLADSAAKESGDKEEHPGRVSSYTHRKLNTIFVSLGCPYSLDKNNMLTALQKEV